MISLKADRQAPTAICMNQHTRTDMHTNSLSHNNKALICFEIVQIVTGIPRRDSPASPVSAETVIKPVHFHCFVFILDSCYSCFHSTWYDIN